MTNLLLYLKTITKGAGNRKMSTDFIDVRISSPRGKKYVAIPNSNYRDTSVCP